MKPPTAIFPIDKRAFERHELALKNLLNAPNPFLLAQATDELGKCLTHPAHIFDSAHLFENHPLYQDALRVTDAWEAVSNGMYVSDIFEELERMGPNSPFRPWREAILAMHFFYEGLDEAAWHHISLIPDHWYLAALKPAFKFLLNPSLPSSGPYQRLRGLVLSPKNRSLELLRNLVDSLQTSLEDAFQTSWQRLCESWPENNYSNLKQLNVWLWGQLAWQDFSEIQFMNISVQFWGESESYRLAALGCFGWDPEGGLYYWCRFLLSARRDHQLDQTIQTEALVLLWDMVAAVTDFQLEHGICEGWEKDWAELALAWNAEKSPLDPGWPATWASARSPGQQRLPRPKARKQETGQLDLFTESDFKTIELEESD